MGKSKERTLDVALTDEERDDVRRAAEEYAQQMLLDGTAQGLSAEAIRLAYVMATPLTGSSPRGWAEIAGVGHMTYYRNYQRPEFAALLEQIRQRKFAKLETLADRRLAEIIDRGGDKAAIAAIRTLKEELGRFVRRVETTHTELTPAEREARRRMRERLGSKQEETGERTDGRVLQ